MLSSIRTGQILFVFLSTSTQKVSLCAAERLKQFHEMQYQVLILHNRNVSLKNAESVTLTEITLQ